METFDPFRQIAFDPPAGRASTDAEDLLPTAAVAVGLALQKGRRPMIRINLCRSIASAARSARRCRFGTVASKSPSPARCILRDARIGRDADGATRRSGRNRQQLDSEIAAAQRETQRLHSIIQQVQQFEQRKAQLQQRVVLIEQLRKESDRARCTCSTRSAARCRRCSGSPS